MKINRRQLRRIIQEEVGRVTEGSSDHDKIIAAIADVYDVSEAEAEKLFQTVPEEKRKAVIRLVSLTNPSEAKIEATIRQLQKSGHIRK